MAENQEITTQSATPPEDSEPIEAVPVRRRSLLQRIGCLILLVIWFGILLLPCFFILLATQQEIVISQGSLPGQQIRIWLIMEEKLRGIGISSTGSQEMGDNSCLETHVRYLLWQGEGEATSFCDCFSRSGETWLLAETYQGACLQE